MISEYTISQVTEKSKVIEVVGDFIQLKKNGSDSKCLCPFHDEKTPSFCVKESDNFYKCFSCGRSGDSVQFLIEYKKLSYQEAIQHLCNKYKIVFEQTEDQKSKVYVKPPAFKNTTELQDVIVKHFAERKLSQNTLKKLKITDGKEWMPEGKFNGKIVPSGERIVMKFNYFRNDELVNIKYRDSIKTFRLFKDAELILYNLDSIKGAKECFWVEGEPDCATLVEAGIMREGVAVVSVPNGASKGNNNLIYLDNCIDLLDNIETHILGFDNDPNGRKLREDIAERLGKEKCKFIEWKDKKDANDVLKAYNIDGVIECCGNKKEFPLVGISTISTYSNDIDDMYSNGMDRGLPLNMGKIDKLIRFAQPYITVITGIPNHGKSDWLDMMILKLMTHHGWKVGYYSPENKPTKLHFSKLARKLIGKNWFGGNRISEAEKNLCKSYLEDKVYFIKPEKDFTLNSILESVKLLKMRKGINCFVLDAWNRIEHKHDGKNETKYVNESLLKLDAFCELYNIHCFLVAHPVKIEKDKKTGQYLIPTLYNISGSSHFYNIIANGITVYRDFKEDVTKVFVQKVKFSHWGEIGYAEFKYDKESGRYNEYNVEAGFTFKEDGSNWIIGNQVQATMNIPEVKEDGIHVNAHISDGDMPF